MAFTDPAQAAAYKAAWYQANKARVRAKNRRTLRAWRKSNPAKVRDQNRRHWVRHGTAMTAKVKAWRKANPARVLAQARAWRERNREQYRFLAKVHYLRHRQQKIQKVAEYQRRSCATLGAYYVRHKLSRGTRVPLSAWPTAMVQAKQAQLKLHRTLWQHRKTSTN